MTDAELDWILLTHWLNEHGKDDLFECTWLEIKTALEFVGRECPLADYATEQAREGV